MFKHTFDHVFMVQIKGLIFFWMKQQKTTLVQKINAESSSMHDWTELRL